MKATAVGIIPSLLAPDGFRIDGLSILEERGDAVGRALWLTHRMVRGRFVHRDRPVAEEAPSQIVAHLRAVDDGLANAVAELWSSQMPENDDQVGRFVQLSQEAARILAEINLVDSAFAFFQTAALIDHRSPHAALAAARHARDHARFALAEVWYEEFLTRARHARDTAQVVLALLGRGNLRFIKGNYPGALRHHQRALRLARRYGHHREYGMAAHDLSAVYGEMGQFAMSDRFAEEAARAYGAGHPRLPNLVHDVATSWIDRGEFAAALPVFRAVVPLVRDQGDRLLTWSNVARAAGGAGSTEEYATAVAAVIRMQRERHWTVRDAQSYLNLAFGAHHLRRLPDARKYAKRAMTIAARRGEGGVQLVAEALIDSARAGRSVLVRQRSEEEPRMPMRTAAVRDVLLELVSTPARPLM